MIKITDTVYTTDDGYYASARLEGSGFVIIEKQSNPNEYARVKVVYNTLDEAINWIKEYEGY